MCCSAIYTQQREHEIAHALGSIDARFPEIEFGSYPRWDAPDHRVLLTVEGSSWAAVGTARSALLEILDPEHLVRVEEDHRPEESNG